MKKLLILLFLAWSTPVYAGLIFIDEIADVLYGICVVPSIGTGAEGFYWQARYSFSAPDAAVGFPSGVLRNMSMVVEPHDASCTITGVIRTNGASSTVSCSTSGTARQQCFSSNSVDVAAGDTVDVVVSASGGGCVARTSCSSPPGTAGSGRQPMISAEFVPRF